jgi:hypothetical protein
VASRPAAQPPDLPRVGAAARGKVLRAGPADSVTDRWPGHQDHDTQ